LREAQNINPSNVFPRPDLGPSDEWARNVMDRVIALEKEAIANRAGTMGINRSIAATTSNLSDQIKSVVIPESMEITNSGFSLSGVSTWATVASVTVSPPPGTSNTIVIATAVYYLVSSASFARCDVRPVINGIAGMEYELPEGIGASGIPRTGVSAYNRTVSGGASFTVEAQVRGADSSFYTGGANRVCSLNVTAIYTR
jgi:hypothetical protein